ncbi:hypothetical protein SAMN05444355_102369 [Flavobacterium frigoris]|uniref:Uncharacterized protein n=1 Tax=Flavobacterium frigoris TaxID=229204 RepID=A0A1H9G2X1_FLAFI|nr:hypothetical protein SAMN05444355_102369 [Flavobacterium frigoris]
MIGYVHQDFVFLFEIQGMKMLLSRSRYITIYLKRYVK